MKLFRVAKAQHNTTIEISQKKKERCRTIGSNKHQFNLLECWKDLKGNCALFLDMYSYIR